MGTVFSSRHCPFFQTLSHCQRHIQRLLVYFNSGIFRLFRQRLLSNHCQRHRYSINSSATLHDHSTGKVAWFFHRNKRGSGQNWSGTSASTESDMLDELFGKAKGAQLTITELICDKDSSTIMLLFVAISQKE